MSSEEHKVEEANTFFNTFNLWPTRMIISKSKTETDNRFLWPQPQGYVMYTTHVDGKKHSLCAISMFNHNHNQPPLYCTKGVWLYNVGYLDETSGREGERATHPTETWASSANVTDNLGLLAGLGEVRRAGGDGNGEVDDDGGDDATDACFVVCWTSLTDASTSEANISSTSELGNGRLPHDCWVRCKRHRKEPAWVVGAHKHELAFPDTDDVDEDDDEVDTTEDMTMLVGPSLQNAATDLPTRKRNDTKRDRYRLIPLLMQLPTSHENLRLQRRFWTKCERKRFSG